MKVSLNLTSNHLLSPHSTLDNYILLSHMEHSYVRYSTQECESIKAPLRHHKICKI